MSRACGVFYRSSCRRLASLRTRWLRVRLQPPPACLFCSNDPVCAQHDPANPHEERFLHGSACHGCRLIAEPSCELRNDFLDRAGGPVDPGSEFRRSSPVDWRSRNYHLRFRRLAQNLRGREPDRLDSLRFPAARYLARLLRPAGRGLPVGDLPTAAARIGRSASGGARSLRGVSGAGGSPPRRRGLAQLRGARVSPLSAVWRLVVDGFHP